MVLQDISSNDIFANFKLTFQMNIIFEQIKSDFFNIEPWDWNFHKNSIKYLEYYSIDLINEVERRFNAAKEYLTGSSENIRKFSSKNDMTRVQFQHLVNGLLKGLSIIDLVKSQIGYKGKFGLLFAQAELQIYEVINQKKPTSRSKGVNGIYSAINRGEWHQFGVKSWNDLLFMTFRAINLKRDKYTGKNGLKTAMEELKNFQKEKNWLPRNRETGLLGIARAVYGGVWDNFGIKTWNDLLEKAFNKINVKMNYYTGKKGLNHARDELSFFYEKNNRMPTSLDKEMSGIITAIYRGEWISYGITKWNDLINEVFGKTDFRIGIMREEDSLNKIVEELKAFKDNNNRLPVCKDKEMGKIAALARRGTLSSFKIFSWNDLLMFVFGKTNHIVKVYKGKKGLNHAIIELKNHFNQNKHFPKINDKQFATIRRNICKKTWTSYGVNNWEDLLLVAFGKSFFELNRDNGTKKRIKKKNNELKHLKIVKNELRTFYDDNHRLPRVRDQGMLFIQNSIQKGEWRAFGINSWNDLLESTFGEVNQRKNIYTGKKGLQSAISELRNLEIRNGKIPTTYDEGIGGIVRAVKRGEWNDMNISTWNDLLTKVFGKVNIERKKYDGKKGLEVAKEELQVFHSRNGRIPKYRDKEIKGTIGAIQMKKWVGLGISSWNDLLLATFGKTNTKG